MMKTMNLQQEIKYLLDRALIELSPDNWSRLPCYDLILQEMFWHFQLRKLFFNNTEFYAPNLIGT